MIRRNLNARFTGDPSSPRSSFDRHEADRDEVELIVTGGRLTLTVPHGISDAEMFDHMIHLQGHLTLEGGFEAHFSVQDIQGDHGNIQLDIHD